VAGAIIISIGVFLLLGQLMPDVGRWIPLAIGLLFLLGFVGRREYGLLVAGCIISGVGVGVVLEGVVDAPWSGAIVVLSLAGGFIAIWVISTLLRLGEDQRLRPDGRPVARAGWWPLIPGGILALVGLVALAEEGFDSDIVRWWPVLLIAAGVLVLWNSRSTRRTRRGG
jgi:LiaI-LiaF-like transmembrane region